MEKVKGLHLLYKNLGETPLESILRFQKENPDYLKVPMTYAGRLDPMAEGLLLVLSGDLVNEKEKYLSLPKTYEVEVLWGFETDTADLLGVVTKNSSASLVPSRDVIVESIFTHKFQQKYPAYSSKPVSGKPLYKWAREGKLSEIKIPSHEVEIYSAEFISRRTISRDELREDIVNKVGKVSGDFRQEEIVEKWKEVLKNTQEREFTVDKILLNVSSGFYVRQFVSDLAGSLSSLATTFHIVREKVGEFSVKSG